MRTVHYETFALDDDQHENLWAAIERAQQIAGKAGLPKSVLLDMIIVDFLATNAFGKASERETNRAKYLKRIEEALGLKLVALGPDCRVVYGIDTVAWAAGET